MFRSIGGLILMLTVIATVGGAASAQTTVRGQSWPDHPIRFIVPFAAGSSSDTIARIIGRQLSDRLGQQLVIENKVGGASIVGTEAIARAEPDGYTIGLANTSTHAATIGLAGSLSFDPVKDFTPVTLIGSSPFVLLVTPGLPAKNLHELIALAKQHPGTLNYASAGPGTLSHLAAALFENMAGIKLTHVPYRGTEQSMFDLMQGRIEILFGTIAPSLPHIRAGRVRALATTGNKRNIMLPDLETIAEAGLKGYEADLWTALVLPAGAPPAVVKRLNQEVNAAEQDPEVVDLLNKQGVECESGPPEALAERIRTDLEKWRNVVKKAGIRSH
jgi:tripartite-type tricarboxylate transporter receptor subunit TctC